MLLPEFLDGFGKLAAGGQLVRRLKPGDEEIIE
jgi:hypothetical protein